MVGKRFREAVRLAQGCIVNWARIDGSFPQVDLLSLPSRRILNIVYVWLLERMDSEAGQAWTEQLNAPLPGEGMDAAADDFDDSFDQIRQ